MIPNSVFALTFYHRLGKNVHGQKCSVELSRICNKINENSINPAKNQYFMHFQNTPFCTIFISDASSSFLQNMNSEASNGKNYSKQNCIAKLSFFPYFSMYFS